METEEKRVTLTFTRSELVETFRKVVSECADDFVERTKVPKAGLSLMLQGIVICDALCNYIFKEENSDGNDD